MYFVTPLLKVNVAASIGELTAYFKGLFPVSSILLMSASAKV
jgi:hypothetical protein